MGRTERRYWDNRENISRAARAGDPQDLLFDAYVPHPIAGWEPVLGSRTWARLSRSSERCRALSETLGQGDLPAEWLLSRAESIASSTIEDIRPSARRVARAEAQLGLFGEKPPDAEMQALRNIGVTRHASDLAQSGASFTVESLCDMHETLMGDDPIAGRLRERQNWVGAGALKGPLAARHVGPPPEHVLGLLEDLVEYVHRDDGDPLVRAAIAHAQFETIHPFPDGNGRTGRALIQFMLLREEVIGRGTLPISSALMIERPRYFDALDSFRLVCAPDDEARSRSAQPWIEMLAEATFHACILHDRLNSHVEALRQRWAAQATAKRIRPSSAAFRLLDHLPANPVLTADSARRLLDTNERTARHAVARLADAGILEQRSAGRRNRVFECGDMMDAFTESAREQPAANLTLSTPVGAPGPTLPGTEETAKEEAGGICGARTRRGTQCGHPRPRLGGKCPAGHPRS
ncbi:Fic family protein [Candidatus Poriferisodalis sp.]|uniref:Fic family protein n=1 Tax=Candidatus Poriferisodalis sp. TaxID=3101277 RepID=UPI003B01C1E6